MNWTRQNRKISLNWSLTPISLSTSESLSTVSLYNIVNFFWGGAYWGGARIRERRLLESGRSLDHLRYSWC